MPMDSRRAASRGDAMHRPVLVRNISRQVASIRPLPVFGRCLHPLESEKPGSAFVFVAMFREIKGLRYNERPQPPRPPVYLVT